MQPLFKYHLLLDELTVKHRTENKQPAIITRDTVGKIIQSCHIYQSDDKIDLHYKK